MADEHKKLNNMNNTKFIELKEKIKEKTNNIHKINACLKVLNSDLNKHITELQSICKHKYEREYTDSGCYREYISICKLCNKC